MIMDGFQGCCEIQTYSLKQQPPGKKYPYCPLSLSGLINKNPLENSEGLLNPGVEWDQEVLHVSGCCQPRFFGVHYYFAM